MSDDKRKILTQTLTQLNREERVWAINYLVQLLAASSSERGIVKVVKKRPLNTFTEDQWAEYFKGQPSKDLPEETTPLTSVLHATAGKTIKPLAKWL